MSRKAWIVGAAVVMLSIPGIARADDKLDPEAGAGATPFAEDHLESYTTGMLIGYLEIFQRGTDAASQERAAKIASHLSQTDANWRVSAAAAAALASGGSGSGSRTARSSRRLKRDDAPTPTPTPTRRTVATSGGSSNSSGANVVATSGGSSRNAVTPTPTASAAPAAPVSFANDEARQDEIAEPTPTPAPTPITVATRRTDWFAAAQDQMQSFWEAGGEVAGAAPKGKIYDPATGQLVSLDDHTGKVGVDQAFDDELSNTSSGAGAGTMKRITDK